jgi:hypothetical protein
MKSRPDILFFQNESRVITRLHGKAENNEIEETTIHHRNWSYWYSRHFWNPCFSLGSRPSRLPRTFSRLPTDSPWNNSMSRLDFIVKAHTAIPRLYNRSCVLTCERGLMFIDMLPPGINNNSVNCASLITSFPGYNWMDIHTCTYDIWQGANTC